MSLPMKPKYSQSCLSDFHIDQLLAGEIADPAASHSHLRSCPDCAQRFDEIAEERDTFAHNAPALELEPTRRTWLWPTAGVAAAAAVAAIAVGSLKSHEDAGEPPGIRRKGGDRIGFYVKHGDAKREGAPGEVVNPGDALRFAYSIDVPRYLAIFSVDGAATVSVYFPEGDVAVRVDAGRDIALPRSTILDSTLGTETIYALFCDHALELGPVRAAFESTPRDPPLPPGCIADRVNIEKKARP